MNYTALYRKYRSNNFDEVVGQKHIVQTLKNAVEKNRIAHAYLFCGPRGTGKTSIAKIFAKMLNCEKDHLHPCGECENCRLIKAGTHPDVIEIDAASNNGVDEVRSLIERVKYSPILGRYKVYIIDEVHMMSSGAFNALLKTIEEPPENVIFILATTEPNKVLPTIISRCQRYDFTSIPQADIINRLSYVCEQEKIPFEREALELVAQLADGGMRDALSILDQVIAYNPDEVKLEDVRAIYGVVTKDDIGKIYQAIEQKDIDQVTKSLNDISQTGMDLKKFTADFISLLKDSLILSLSKESPIVSNSSKEAIHTYFEKSSQRERLNLLDELMGIYTKFSYASDILDYLESAIIKFIYKSYEQPSAEIAPKVIFEKPMLSEKKINSQSEKSHDFRDTGQKSPISSSKSAESIHNSISDVSRETFSSTKKNEKREEFSSDFLLSLLVGANKKSKEEDQGKLAALVQYENDMKYAKYAMILKKIKILASSQNYILIFTPNKIQAKEINAVTETPDFLSFDSMLLGKPKQIFAISHKNANELLKLFKERQVAGTLPEAAEIELAKEPEQGEILNTTEVKVRELFPSVEFEND